MTDNVTPIRPEAENPIPWSAGGPTNPLTEVEREDFDRVIHLIRSCTGPDEEHEVMLTRGYLDGAPVGIIALANPDEAAAQTTVEDTALTIRPVGVMMNDALFMRLFGIPAEGSDEFPEEVPAALGQVEMKQTLHRLDDGRQILVRTFDDYQTVMVMTRTGSDGRWSSAVIGVEA